MNEKKTLSKKEINALSNIVINHATIGNIVKLLHKKINSDEFELKIELVKFTNLKVMTFVNCNFDASNVDFDCDEDIGTLTETLTLRISESSYLNFKNKLDEEGFGFLLELEDNQSNGKNS